jgi:hypothetical protein
LNVGEVGRFDDASLIETERFPAAEAGHLEVLQWVRATGCLWDPKPQTQVKVKCIFQMGGSGHGTRGWYNESYGGGWNITDSTWLRAVNNKSIYTAGTFYTDGNKSVIRGSSQTLYLRDTNERSGMIHMNSNRMYFLSGGTDSESWAKTANCTWPLHLQTDNYNDINFCELQYFCVREDSFSQF